METLTIELLKNTSLKAVKELEQKSLIHIIKQPDLNSYALPGEEVSYEDFKSWVKYAENTATMSLAEAKGKWEIQKQKLQEDVH